MIVIGAESPSFEGRLGGLPLEPMNHSVAVAHLYGD